MRRNLRLILSIALLSLQPALFAAENAASPAPEINILVNNGQYEEALAIAQENLVEWEGEDPLFDFLFGLSSLEVGYPNDAVFALERVVASATDTLLRERARLELARAYFVTNNLTAAKNLFNVVLANNPPTNVQQNVEAFLLLIESRQNAQSSSFRWTISSYLGSDSNVNSATSLGTIGTPIFGDIELDPRGQQIEDEFSDTTAQMTYKYVFTRDRFIDVDVDLTHLNNFQTDDFDIDNLRAGATYNWGSNINRFTHGFTASKVILDKNGFQDSLALTSSWQHAGNNGWYQTIAGAFTKIKYDTSNGQDTNDLRDVDQTLLTGGLTKISGPYTHSFNLYYADEDAKHKDGGAHNGRDFAGLAYSLLYQLNAQHTPYLRVSYQEVKHKSEHPVFFRTVRNDDIESVTAGWFYQFDRNLMINGEAYYSDNTSNIPLFDYHRFKFQAGFRYQF